MPTTAEIADFIATDFPQNNCIIEASGDKGATMRHIIDPQLTRWEHTPYRRQNRKHYYNEESLICPC